MFRRLPVMMLHIAVRRLRAVVIATALVVLLPAVALAHAELVTATPADKSVSTEPVAEVSGVYSEAMTPEGSSLVVKDATGTVVATGSVDPADDTRMVATPTSPLGEGIYRVESTSVATDGHAERTTWTFTMAIRLLQPPTAAPSVSPTAAAPSAPSSAATPGPSDAGTISGGGSDVVVPIVVALIVLGAGAAYLLRQRRRPSDAA